MSFLKIFNKKRNKLTAEKKEELLNKALTFSSLGKFKEAHEIYHLLYQNEDSTMNAFNLLQTSIHCKDVELEKKLYNELKDNKAKNNEPKELNGPFVRFYYAIILCDNHRNNEAIEIVDYLLSVISEHEVTNSNYLYNRGIPHVGMMRDLIKKVFVNDDKMHEIYKHKLLDAVDEDAKQALKERYNF